MASNVLPRLSFLPSSLSRRKFTLTVLRFASEELDGCFRCEQHGDAVPIPQRLIGNDCRGDRIVPLGPPHRSAGPAGRMAGYEAGGPDEDLGEHRECFRDDQIYLYRCYLRWK